MTSDHLYIIGNGFDCYHGAKCSYAEFRKYLLRHRPYVLANFDLYFGPRSLMNSFGSFKDCTLISCISFIIFTTIISMRV